MPGAARQFEPQITRTGGVPSKFRFTARCSECRSTNSYEASKPVPDEVVARHFNSTGWVLGRDRSFDLCPACLRAPGAASQNPEMREAQGRRLRAAAGGSDRGARSATPRPQKIDDILARHLGKPEALAAEVFQPKQAQVPRPTTPDPSPQPISAPALSPKVEQALTGMAADLKSLRATMELVAEQMSRLVAFGGQQIEAIARLAPVMVRSTDRISSELKDVVQAVRLASGPSDHDVQHPPAPLIEPHTERDQKGGSEIEPAQTVQPATSLKRTRRSKATESTGHKSAAAHVAVKSIADAKRPDRFYTTIRLPRELWDRSGFGPEDRIQLDWKKKTVSISRVSDGGVKPKTIGDAVVVLQSWRLGDLTFDPTKITLGNGVLRLKSP